MNGLLAKNHRLLKTIDAFNFFIKRLEKNLHSCLSCCLDKT